MATGYIICVVAASARCARGAEEEGVHGKRLAVLSLVNGNGHLQRQVGGDHFQVIQNVERVVAICGVLKQLAVSHVEHFKQWALATETG